MKPGKNHRFPIAAVYSFSAIHTCTIVHIGVMDRNVILLHKFQGVRQAL